MKEVKLTQGKVALVDDEDFEYLNQFKWYADKKPHTWYAARKVTKNGVQTSIRMHSVILHIDDDFEVDHIDHNGLNCQKNNIRRCIHAQNMKNRKSRGISKYLGVSPSDSNKKPWRAFIRPDKNTKISLGYFETEQSAALAYNNAALTYHQEFANLNILEPSF